MLLTIDSKGGGAKTLNAGHGGSKILQIVKILSLHDSAVCNVWRSQQKLNTLLLWTLF